MIKIKKTLFPNKVRLTEYESPNLWHEASLLSFRAVGPSIFLHQDGFMEETVCPGIQVEGMVCRNDSSGGFYCALHSSYYYISFTSDHQALDLETGDPCLGEHNLTGNCHFKSISSCSGC